MASTRRRRRPNAPRWQQPDRGTPCGRCWASTSAARSPISSPMTRRRSTIEVWKELSVPGDPVDRHPERARRTIRQRRLADIRARHHGRHQRHAGAQGRGRRLRHDRGLPRRPVHPARQPQVPLRHELGEAEAAGRSAATASRSTSAIDAYGQVRDRRWTRPRCARSRRAIRSDAGDPGGRRLPPVLLPQPGARAARRRRSSPRSCPSCRSRSPTRCCRSGRSTSAPRPPSPTPI